jgi:hypothetical protein
MPSFVVCPGDGVNASGVRSPHSSFCALCARYTGSNKLLYFGLQCLDAGLDVLCIDSPPVEK